MPSSFYTVISENNLFSVTLKHKNNISIPLPASTAALLFCKRCIAVVSKGFLQLKIGIIVIVRLTWIFYTTSAMLLVHCKL